MNKVPFLKTAANLRVFVFVFRIYSFIYVEVWEGSSFITLQRATPPKP